MKALQEEGLGYLVRTVVDENDSLFSSAECSGTTWEIDVWVGGRMDVKSYEDLNVCLNFFPRFPFSLSW